MHSALARRVERGTYIATSLAEKFLIKGYCIHKDTNPGIREHIGCATFSEVSCLEGVFGQHLPKEKMLV
jgi:hypothetical protein